MYEDEDDGAAVASNLPDTMIQVRRADVPTVKAFFDAHGAALKDEAYKLKGLGPVVGKSLAVGLGNSPHLVLLGLYSEIEEASRPFAAGGKQIERQPLLDSVQIMENLMDFYRDNPGQDNGSTERLSTMQNELIAMAGALKLKIVMNR